MESTNITNNIDITTKTYEICNSPMPANNKERVNLILVTCLALFLAIATMVTNLIVQYVFIVKLKRYKKSSDVLLILLGVSDFLAGLLVHPALAYSGLLWSKNKTSCQSIKYIGFMGLIMMLFSLTTIAFITFEMYQKITKPFNEKISRKIVLCIMSPLWAMICVIVTIFIYTSTTLLPKLMGALSALSVLTYVVICVAHYKINREIKSVIHQGNATNPTLFNVETIRNASNLSRSVVIAFGCCYSPITLLALSSLTFENMHVFTMYIRPWSLLVIFSNPFLDPILYCLRMKSIRKEVFQVLRFQCRKTLVSP